MPVRLPRTRTADVGQTIVHEATDELVDDAVVALASDLASGHQPEVAEECELVAHRRHRESEGVRKVADAQLVVRERVHEPKPHGVRERVKDLHRLCDDLLGRQAGAHALDLLCVYGGGKRRRLHS